ncbi:HDOD domain-containing protein [Inmirania thermothiophila]|uniref:Putative nucleotidyltransferase with HDIG domain n=1 Tax=Inmirania thermothiophila TaxID=1750597 RepID=A0A3N1XZT4_9GAMM|nr:HDOD domain-containing protein [Inmirania thermothiophila]ROR32113.1 putative nucleotidyltransferase with HDIG domain [Inmirania thermothiophila]
MPVDAAAYIERIREDLEADRLVLPTLPEVALRVREVVDDPDADADAIAEAVAQDGALAARLVQVANSPLYRAARPIEDLHTAVTRLGLGVVRNLVTSFAMRQIFQPTTEAVDEALRALWAHGVEVAAISAALAKARPGFRSDEALLAGLVHDIGKLPVLALAELEPDLGGDPVLLAEVLSTTHAELGRAILEAWDFPEALVKVAAEHDDLERKATEADYVDIVQVANLQAYLGTDHPWGRLDWSGIGAFDRLGIDTTVEEVDIGADPEQVAAARELVG